MEGMDAAYRIFDTNQWNLKERMDVGKSVEQDERKKIIAIDSRP
jgi:hypothetical protein